MLGRLMRGAASNVGGKLLSLLVWFFLTPYILDRVGPARFAARLENAGLLMVSHSTSTIRSYCTCGLVLEGGRVRFYRDVEEAIATHERNMAA